MKKITIYKDFDHQNNHEIEETLKSSPAERIAQVVAMIKKIYPSIKPDTTKRINFRNEYFS